MSRFRRHHGFTLIELLLSVAIIGVIATFAMVGQRHSKALRRDVVRVSHMTEMQKALALYLANNGGYPEYNGCINGVSDPVSTSLHASRLIGADADFKDPLYPTDVTKCYYYQGTGSAYTLRYTLEKTSSSGEQGDHIIVP